ncbi:MAG TPA: hypothetical protein VNU28_03885 [Solirubrobacteraceae bacterium]|jgi:hypothetical protein|nr:hypothetical protein [Solirubrobacteraceae bacterium]
MGLALGTAALVLMMLLSVLALPHLKRLLGLAHRRLSERIRIRRLGPVDEYDPGRELRAEQRARALLRSCVNEEEWGMYRELGFLRVRGTLEAREYAYLVYPHKPILAYVPSTNDILGEYCIEFPDRTRPYGSTRLPDSDDVLAKWMALTADERALIEQANLHLAGRQIRVAKARRDLLRLACWERERGAASLPRPARAEGLARGSSLPGDGLRLARN